MKLWKPAVCLLLSGLLLSACAAPAGSASSGAEGNPGGSSEAGPETAPKLPPGGRLHLHSGHRPGRL